MPWNPATGMFEVAGPARAGGGYGRTGATGLGGWHDPADKRSQRYVGGSLLPAERGNEARAGGLADRYDSALGDIEGTVGRFSDIYRKAGEAISAPAARDFQIENARIGANAASRFGGNISSEELRGGYNAQDLFSRNLTEALARLGGEQVNAGLNYTGQLGSAAAQSAEERDRLRALILQGLSQGRARQTGGGIGGALGGLLGGAAGAFLNPLGTALGKSIGGG